MLRTLIYLLLTIFLITFLRGVIGLIGRAFGQLFQPSSPTTGSKRAGSPASRHLKQCATCGVYTSEATALKHRGGGKEHFFCSAECREKYKA